MSKEEFNDIIKHAKESLEKNILDQISEFRYSEIDDYFVIQVYVKEGTKAINLGEILTNIEDYARAKNIAVLVDFLRG